MFGIDDALIGAGISAAASLIGGSEANESREEQSEAQMKFQERMSNTSYQRAVSDLNAAGLNPMLAYAHGGASTPAGSQAQIEDIITPAVNSAHSAYRAVNEATMQKEQINDIRASVGLKEAQAEQASTQAALNLQAIDKSKQDIIHSAASVDLMSKQGQYLVEQITKIAPEIKVLVSQERLNMAQREHLLAELPKIAAEIPRIKAETDVAYQERLLKAIETRLHELKQNKGQFESDMYKHGGIGYKADAFKKGASVIPGLNWLFKGD